jgi:hypothetical protein
MKEKPYIVRFKMGSVGNVTRSFSTEQEAIEYKDKNGGNIFKLATEEKEIAEIVHADWKDFTGFIEELTKVLPKFGLKIYDVPGFEGTDEMGVIISNKKLSKKTLEKDFGPPKG